MGMKALIIVDIQNDFLPGGALEVPKGDEVIPVINELQQQFDLIVATQDWHPADHGSFAVNHLNVQKGDVIDLYGVRQILWPVHCVQNTRGAELAEQLDKSKIDRVFYKGTDPKVDSYSAFFDNDHSHSTGLSQFFRDRRVDEVAVVGLAGDYCVKFTALDSVAEGFRTTVVKEACRAVNLNPRDFEKALDEMKVKGVKIR